MAGTYINAYTGEELPDDDGIDYNDPIYDAPGPPEPVDVEPISLEEAHRRAVGDSMDLAEWGIDPDDYFGDLNYDGTPVVEKTKYDEAGFEIEEDEEDDLYEEELEAREDGPLLEDMDFYFRR